MNEPPGIGPAVSRRVMLGGMGLLGVAAAPSWAQPAPDLRGVRAATGRTSPAQAPILMPRTDMHVGPIHAVAVSSDGTLVATGSADRSIRLWRAATGEGLLRLNLPLGEGNIGVVDALAFSPDYRRLYVSGLDWAAAPGSSRGMVYVFDLARAQLVGLMGFAADFGSRLRTLAVSPSGAQIAMAAGNNGLVVRDAEPDGFKLRYTDLSSATVTISAVAYAPDGKLLATASSKGRLRLLDVTAEGDVREVSNRALPGNGQPDSLAFSSDGERLAIGYGDRPMVQVVPVRSAAPVVTLAPPPGSSNGNLAAVAWGRDADGQTWLFAGGTVVNPAGRNLLLGWRDGRAGNPAVLPVSSDSITQLAAHPKAGVLFGSSDPRWGSVMPEAGNRSLRLVRAQETERLDFRGVPSRGWGIDATGSTVEFRGGRTTLRFDLSELTLARAVTPRTDLSRPRPVADRTAPPKAFGLSRGTLLRAVDAEPAQGRSLSGTDDYLILADAAGRELQRREIATAAWGVAMARNGKVAVAAHGDGTIRWYGVAPNQALAELGGLFVTADEQRWVAWRADGRFAHSPGGGARLVGFLQNGQFAPGQVSQGGLTGHWLDIDQLYRQLYDPDQVRQMLEGAASPPTARAEINQQRLPVISIRSLCAADDWSAESRGIRASKALSSTPAGDDPGALPADTGACRTVDDAAVHADDPIALPQGTKAMRVQLSLDAASAATQLAVFVNEQNVGHSLVRQAAGRAVGVQPVEQHVPLFPGENRVEFRAYGADNLNFTRAPTILRVNVADAAPGPGATGGAVLHVLVAGIDAYQGSIHPLKFAKADAEAFAKAVQQRAAREYARSTVVTLFDGEATVDAVSARLATIAANARATDAVVIYFSGHGVVGTVDRSYAFVTADATDANAVLRGGQGMGAERLARGLVEMRAERVFLFLDTCYAGGFDPRTIGYLNQDTGRYVLAASTRLEEAQDSYDGVNGLFAYAVKESLGGTAPAAGRSIDAFDVGRYVTGRVEELARKRAWQQRAVFQAAGQITAFPLFSPAT